MNIQGFGATVAGGFAFGIGLEVAVVVCKVIFHWSLLG